MRPRCRCGRFLANAVATPGIDRESYDGAMFVASVTGDCSRCGPGQVAVGDGSWDWDNWKWPDEVAYA